MVKNSRRDQESTQTLNQDQNPFLAMCYKKKKSSGCGPMPKGDPEPGLTPPIPFVPAKVDESDEPLTVDITIRKTPLKKATKNNCSQEEMEL
jgi:hypothetical protein